MLCSQGRNFTRGLFAGWMLLNYQQPVQVSSTLGGFKPNFAVDEDIKTYWSAQTGNRGEWIQTDLGSVATIHALQINDADQDAEFLGKTLDGKLQYMVYGSIDGLSWEVVVYGANEYYFTGMDRFDPYYFQIEAFNENGISPRSDVVMVE